MVVYILPFRMYSWAMKMIMHGITRKTQKTAAISRLASLIHKKIGFRGQKGNSAANQHGVPKYLRWT